MLNLMPPEMIPVQSSNLKAYGYRESEQLLFVAFEGKYGKPDTLYRYREFPPSAWADFRAAVSKGQYHAKHIVGRYPYERIG
jgi:KTSC domain